MRITCNCGKKFSKPDSTIKPNRDYHCSLKCKKASTQRADGTYKCGACKEWVSGDDYKWYKDDRYASGLRRFAYCNSCKKKKRNKYNSAPGNKEKAAKCHADWRERCIKAGGDRAIRYWFARQMGGYRKTARRFDLECSIDPEYLLSLFHEQGGKCYYSGVVLNWMNFGKKQASANSMTVDRKNPVEGYTKENVVLCTFLINTTKGRRTEAEFYESCELILAHKAH